jgi:hypothetical protein
MLTTPFEEKGKIFTRVVTKKPIEVTIETISHRIKGQIHIRPEDRIKDELNRGETFVALTNATIYNKAGEKLFQCNFISINCAHIVWLVPDEEIQG